jgi:transposase
VAIVASLARALGRGDGDQAQGAVLVAPVRAQQTGRLGVELRQGDRSQQRLDVNLVLRFVTAPGQRLNICDRQVLLHQLGDRRPRLGVPLLVDLVEQTCSSLLRETSLPRPRRHDLSEVERLPRDWVNAGVDTHVVLDNLSTHTTPDVQAWLAKNPHVQFHFTPVGSSWINQIETWFGIITRQSIRRGTFTTVNVLINQIRDYITHWNTNPKLFTWTATADEILAKVRLVQINIKKLVDNNAK